MAMATSPHSLLLQNPNTQFPQKPQNTLHHHPYDFHSSHHPKPQQGHLRQMLSHHDPHPGSPTGPAPVPRSGLQLRRRTRQSTRERPLEGQSEHPTKPARIWDERHGNEPQRQRVPLYNPEAEADLRTLLNIPPEYSVLFLQGGATTQFAAYL
ncbi:hypothetical protein GBA52_025941 [Prunus armeniaca]|nr:hypothetical protein GBA52_025941 [Prunus armeniaca]